MNRGEILVEVQRRMAEMFELEPTEIREDCLLREDLDLDSLDAIDLAIRIQELTGDRVEESVLRKVRTVGDVVDLIAQMLSTHAG
ncbi:MAG TPA: acyl carrier protein [Polyangiaceae bacterium]|nr:acyl carrier protein [Polyangiaceae bacterium]